MKINIIFLMLVKQKSKSHYVEFTSFLSAILSWMCGTVGEKTNFCIEMSKAHGVQHCDKSS